MNDDYLLYEQVILDQDIKLRSTWLIDALCQMYEPCIQIAIWVALLDVIALIVGINLCHLSVDLVLSEVVVLDISG